MPIVKIKIFNPLIENIVFFDRPIKSKRKTYENLAKMSRNNDYTTENLLDYSYHQNYYKLIGIDLSKQTNTTIPQQINFTENLEKDTSATMFFIAKKLKNSKKLF